MTRTLFSRIPVRLGLAAVAVLLSLFATAAARGGASARATVSETPLFAGARVPDGVLESVARACQDCHSDNTRWPWYSKIPPISWQIHRDVARARRFMDLGKWNEYSDAQRSGFLLSIAAASNAHLVPPARYVLVHPRAKLSEAELAGVG